MNIDKTFEKEGDTVQFLWKPETEMRKILILERNISSWIILWYVMKANTSVLS